MQSRRDVFTRDALAWALAARGSFEQAWKVLREVKESFPAEARLYLHAGLIALQAAPDEAPRWLNLAHQYRFTLYPSEADLLAQARRASAALRRNKRSCDR